MDIYLKKQKKLVINIKKCFVDFKMVYLVFLNFNNLRKQK